MARENKHGDGSKGADQWQAAQLPTRVAGVPPREVPGRLAFITLLFFIVTLLKKIVK